MSTLDRSRRDFLKRSVGASMAIGSGICVPACLSQAAGTATDNERVLVVIQLTGGNDGLNTVVPYADANYHQVRPELAINQSDVLNIDDEVGLHPSMRGLRDLVDAGQFSVIQSVGYENPNRSHFESMDIWHTGARKQGTRDAGWLGRFLESQQTDALSRTNGGDVPAIHLGDDQQPLALTSQHVRVPTVKRLDEFRLQGDQADKLRELLDQELDSSSGAARNELLDFLRSSTSAAIGASDRVAEATKSAGTATRYPSTPLGEKLRVIAQLIDAGLQTRVYYVQLDGFDTHAAQPDAHAVLLKQWSEALTSFMQDMTSRDQSERVCVMTFSEFGRRVAENASSGTDHGAAGPMFLAGGSLAKTIVGAAPDLTDLQDGDLKHQIDFRSVYTTLVADWLGGDPKAILSGTYPTLPLFT